MWKSHISVGIAVGGRIINTIRYADDRAVVANRPEMVTATNG